MNSRLRWFNWILLIEAAVVLMSLAYTGRSRFDVISGGEGNKIVRLFVDDPTRLESFLYLFVAFHVIFALLLFIAWLSAKRRR